MGLSQKSFCGMKSAVNPAQPHLLQVKVHAMNAGLASISASSDFAWQQCFIVL